MADMDMVELPYDEERRKELRGAQRKESAILGVSLTLFVILPPALLMTCGFIILGVVLLILLLLLWLALYRRFAPDTHHGNYSALWNQSVQVGPDCLIFHRWKGKQKSGRGKQQDNFYFTDASPILVGHVDWNLRDDQSLDFYFTDALPCPFCICSIESYQVDEEEILVSGSFWDDYREPNDDIVRPYYSGTQRVYVFEIARIFSDEDEAALLACLDRLKQE